MTNEETVAYYAQHVADSDWGSEKTQRLRWDVISGVVQGARDGWRWLDVGCGTGGFASYFYSRSAYCGWDLTPEMIHAANHKHPGWQFHVRDILASAEERAFDYVVASGMFTHRDEGWMRIALYRMWELCRHGIAFNCLSTWGDKPDPQEFQANPLEAVAFCRKRLSPHVVLRHDYLPYDFTVYVYRGPSR